MLILVGPGVWEYANEGLLLPPNSPLNQGTGLSNVV